MLRPRHIAAAFAASLCLAHGEVVISEFVAENDGHLLDVDGASSDWIELYNNGAAAVSLSGWFLSDDSQQPFLWPLPAMTLNAGERRVIFASGKDRRNPAAELHTNFSLGNNAGGYLALRKPDGTYPSLFNGYPAQRADISFGEGNVVDSQDLVAASSTGKYLVPANGTLGTTWTALSFNDAAWTASSSRIGYQVGGASSSQPIAYWTFDDTTANNIATGPAVDLLGATYNTSFPGAIGEGKSLGFTRAQSQYASATLDVSETSYASSFWFRTTQATTGLFAVVDSDLGTGGHDRHVYLSGGNIGVRTWNNEVIASTGKNYADNQWHHVVHTYGSSIPGQRIYVDGIQVASGAKAASDFNWQKKINIGFSNDAGAAQYHEGQIDDVSIWNETLSPAAVSILASGTQPDMLAGLTPYVTTNSQTAMRNVNASVYLRLPFTVNRVTPFNAATLKVRYDDGFVAYIDGVEVARRNAPATPAWNSTAASDRTIGEASVLESIDISASAALLTNGNHVLAIHGMNDTAGSAEFLINAELSGATVTYGTSIYMDPPTPGTANTTGFLGFVADTNFIPKRGLYSAAQNVNISCATPGATIAYTLDGSDPSPTIGTQVPAANAAAIPTVTLSVSATGYIRAMAYKSGSGLRSTNVDSHTYIFTSQVLTQSNTPPGYPTSWVGRAADYAMDPNVVNTALPGYSVAEGLVSLPTISMTSPIASLFSPTAPAGIYYDTSQRGMAGERKVSIEWINPDGSPGWHVQAGVRPHGNSSRGHGFTPKHPLRLNFRSDYGWSRLKEDIFNGGVKSFDQLLLRACSTDSMPVIDGDVSDGEQRWNNDKATYMRDQYMRDLMNALGHPNCRGVYAHLYINGLYWGLYNLAERPNAVWFSTTFGGDETEWDVLKDFQEVNDGNATAWNEMVAIVNDAGITDAVRCQKLLGNNPDGTRNPAYPIYIHWPSFRDYMIAHIAAGAEDWPDHNYWVGRRRGPLSEGFRFVAWDQEISNDSLTRTSGRGSAAPFASVGDPAVDGGYTFGPAKIYDKFRRAEPFKTMFRERIHQLLFNNGPLSPTGQKARWAALQTRIDKAIVCESARWGDANGEGAKKRETTWLNNMNYMNAAGTGYWDAILPIDVARFRSVQLYPSIDQPTFSQNGGTVPAGFQLYLTHAEPVLYYTLDGSDPMSATGAPSPTAQIYNGGLTTESPIPANSVWKYLVTASAPVSTWKNSGFNDSAWPSGAGQLGYGDGDEGTVIGFGGNASNRNITTYFRKTFTITNKASIQSAKALVLRDDGAVIYLNGTELGRSNMPPTSFGNTTLASSNVTGADESTLYYEFTIPVASLIEGTNTLAVEVHKSSATEDDLSFDGRVDIVRSSAASGIVLNSSGTVRTRARTAALEWSGVNSAYFTVGSQPPSPANVVISEIHYNPAPPARSVETAISTNPDMFEFVELMNVGPTTVDFTGAKFTDGVVFDFPTGYTLAPGARCVVVRSVAAFEARYGTGRAVAGIFGLVDGAQTGLSNGGETLTLALTVNNITTPLFSATYDDIAPWPVAADGNGPSLVLRSPAPNIDHNNAANWTASADIGGSPAQSSAQMTFGQWRTAYSDSLSAGGDDDGDGIPNALEYALSLNPFVRNTGVLPAGQFVSDGGQTYLAITFRHRPAADLATVAEVSDTLADWSSGASVVLVSSTDHGDGTFTQTWRSATPYAPGGIKQFMRIRTLVSP
ncbi:MAG: hypothetical protein RL088_1724 [Verrucomicrobiota bacterium]|jgi:hypothetical protein